MIISNRQKKIMANQVEQEKFLKEKKLSAIEKRWEDAQVKAAGIQSVLDYAVSQFIEHKAELEEEQQKAIEEQISLRQKEIEEFLMAEKDIYLESMKSDSDR